MTIENYSIFVIIILLIYVAIGNYLYFKKILPVIGKSPSVLPSGQFKDIRKYIDILSKKEEYPWFYSALKNIRIITLIVLLLWLPVILTVIGAV